MPKHQACKQIPCNSIAKSTVLQEGCTWFLQIVLDAPYGTILVSSTWYFRLEFNDHF
jgi:hypothetical protein